MICVSILSILVLWGKFLQKELICEHVWALKPLALVAPAMPVHNDSLFAVLRSVVGKEEQIPDGVIWLLVYDLKALMQFLTCPEHFFQKWSFENVWSFPPARFSKCHRKCFNIQTVNALNSGLPGRLGGSHVKAWKERKVGLRGFKGNLTCLTCLKPWSRFLMTMSESHGVSTLEKTSYIFCECSFLVELKHKTFTPISNKCVGFLHVIGMEDVATEN